MGNNSLPYEIVHCSSWDDDYDPEQLVKSSPGNQPLSDTSLPTKCKGWQTPKCPEYPQDLIIHLLSGVARISKIQILSHHFKIATTIDVYVGLLKDAQDVLEDIAPDTPPSDDEDNMLVEFNRLGHVCFDNNARAQFRARELKSIKINADGEYMRLVIRNCHRNRLNEYNQVGILALNILGQPLHSIDKSNLGSTSTQNHIVRHPFDENSILSSSTRRTSISSNQSSVNRIPSSSGIEMEFQQWVSALLQAEEEAVRGESYQIAKRYKYIGDKLERFTKILSDLEIEKRHAVETKDYDEAEKIKEDIKEIKQAAEIMLKQAHIQITNDGNVVPLQSSEAKKTVEEPPSRLDTTPTPTTYHPPPTEITVVDNEPINQWIPNSPPVKDAIPYVEPQHNIPITIDEEEEEEEEEEYIDPDSIPEPIMDEERGPYTLAIQVFGEQVVACVLSIKVKCRGRGLGLIEQRIESLQNYHHSRNDVTELVYFEKRDTETKQRAISNFINATLMMIQEAVMDSREPIVTMAISTWHQLNDLTKDSDIDTDEIITWTERTFSGLLKRTGDTNIKIKNAAIALILVLVRSYQRYSLMSLYVCKPERMIHNYKEAKSRVELVEATVNEFGVEGKSTKNSSKSNHATFVVPLQDLMAFVVAYLNHGHDEVRQSAVKLVVTISDQIGFGIVSTYIDETLRISLAETVQKLVDKDSFHSVAPATKSKKAATTKETMSELRALAVQPEKRTLSSNRSVKRTNTTSSKSAVTPNDKKPTTVSSSRAATTKSATGRTTSTRSKSKPTPPPPATPTAPAELNENSVCIFCDEVSSEFNEDTLIKHYYNTCPVLTNCPMCQIITEISTLNEHMLEDCDKRHLIKECTRCNQAIPVEQWLQHTLKQVCSIKKDVNDVHCPLCLIKIEPPNDAGWKLHLMTGEGCTKLKRSRAPKSTAVKKKTTGIGKKI